jgi:hypothetical protein
MYGLLKGLPDHGTGSLTLRTGPTFVLGPGREFPSTVADVNLCFCIFAPPLLRFTLLLLCFATSARPAAPDGLWYEEGRLRGATRIHLSSGVSALEMPRIEADEVETQAE